MLTTVYKIKVLRYIVYVHWSNCPFNSWLEVRDTVYN